MSNEEYDPEFEGFSDPDDKPQEETFSWGEDIDRKILGMIMGDRQFLLESIDLIKPEYFTNKAHRAFMREIIGYYREYKTIPSQAVVMMKLKQAFKDQDDRLFYLMEYKLCVAAYEPGIDSREFNVNLITGFAKRQAMQNAVKAVADIIKKDDFTKETTVDKIFKILDQAKSVDRKFVDLGQNFFRDIDDRYDRMKQEKQTVEVFSTGYDKIDQALSDGGLLRGELGSVIALPGVGKSLWLGKAAWVNSLRGKRVLYISTEMNEDRIAARFDALYSGMDIRKVNEAPDEIRPVVKKAGRDLFETVGHNDLLIIKQFPPKSSNVDTYRSFLMQLNQVGWAPDMVMLDYIGECKDYSDMKPYESRERLVSEFRGLAVEARFAAMTAMQPNRSAREAQDKGIIDDSNLGDAFGQTRPLDAFWSINQTDQEKKMGVARVFCIKHRNGESRFLFHVEFNKETLEYREISHRTYTNRMQGHQQNVSDEAKLEAFFANKDKNGGRFAEMEDPE